MKKGFTLIELMIVVAIIGILAMIAIPNFTKFQCKAKQSEAKTNLKAIFTSQRSEHAEDGDYNTLAEIGFAPEPGNRYTYCVAADDCKGCETGANITGNKNNCNGVRANEDGCEPTAARTGVNAPTDQFTACATANLDSDGNDRDAWRVNDSNAILNDDNDCE
jgi:type IV pilus assembly protein PilA